jgi:hypothetical protein
MRTGVGGRSRWGGGGRAAVFVELGREGLVRGRAGRKRKNDTGGAIPDTRRNEMRRTFEPDQTT